MSLHAVDNLSHFAHQEREPDVPGRYTYDDYQVLVWTDDDTWQELKKYSGCAHSWWKARHFFLHAFNVTKLRVRLVGRVYK